MPTIFSNSELFWLIALGIPVLVQFLYFMGFFSALFPKPILIKEQKNNALSVIMCCKNEAKNLKELLPLLLNQKHPNFEIIVINDGSWDNSHLIIEEFKKSYSNLKTIYIDPEKKIQAGKKMAITLGIKASANDFLVFTDADCRPDSSEWLNLIGQGFSDKKQVVLGYSPYQKQKGLLNYFIRFETQLTAMMYLSFAKKGMPYMSVGRNWGYQKNLFYESKGFSKHHYIMAGDDDLLLQNLVLKTKAKVLLNKNSFVSSIPKNTWKGWIEQKRRHLQVGKHYKFNAKIITAAFTASYILFFMLLMLSLILHLRLWPWILIIAGLRLVVNWVSFAINAKRLNDNSTAFWFPVAEIMMVMYWLGMGSYVFLSKKREW